MPFGISFTNPWALLLWPPLAFYFVTLARRSLVDLSLQRRRAAVALRLVVLSLIVFALAGFQVVRFNRNLATMFVVDYSDSMPPEAKARAVAYIQNALKNKGPKDEFGVVVFGREAFIELAPTALGKFGKIQTVAPSEFTDIAAAMRLAMATLPDGMQKRLILLSDGNENLGDALEEAVSARSNDVKVDVVPLTSPSRREVLLERLTMPGEAKVGEPVELKVVAHATNPTAATLRLFKDGKLQGQKSIRLSPGKNVFVFPQQVEESGTATFEARIDTAPDTDSIAENNRALGFVNVQGRPRVLVVSNMPEQSRFLVQALASEKVEAEIRGPGGLPPNLQGMQPYDAIVLDNVAAWEMSANQMTALQSYVRDLGCGLVMVGGENSYGPGGYRATPVEEALPVTMDIKHKTYIPGGAVAMIMHSCEFPQGNDWAKSVCSQVTRQLGDRDYAGLVVFGADANWVYEGGMLQVGPNRTYMLTQIRGINPGDMPDFDAALEVAYSGLIKTNAYLKHCIILSDGDPSPPAPGLVKRFRDAKITVSTVAIAPHDNSGYQSMWNIAKQHGGRFYKVMRPAEIPNIFLKEAATVTRSAIVEEGFRPIQTAESSILKGMSAPPPLLGYVGTTTKPTATEILKSKNDDPILATWQYGLGKSVAFTSDARQRWAAAWLPWSGYSKFWAQAVRWSMRGTTSGDLQTNVTLEKGVGKVVIEAVDENGNFLNFLNPKARLVPPDSAGRDLELEQTGPGRYEGTFEARQLGSYLINIRTQRNGKSVSQVVGGVLPYSPEYGAAGADRYLLANVAERSRGDLLDAAKPEQVYGRTRERARLPLDMWLTLLMVAACLFPLDVAIRRLMWGDEELRALGQRVRIKRPGKSKAMETGQPAGRDARMEALLRRKTESVRSKEAPPATSASSSPSGKPSFGDAEAQPSPAPRKTPSVEPTGSDAGTPSDSDVPTDANDALARLREAKRRARRDEDR